MNEFGERIDATTIRFVRVLPGPVERVWEYLVKPELRLKWFAAGDWELKPGGVAQFHFDHRRITDEKPPAKHEKHGGEMQFDGVIVEVAPPRLLVFDWPEETGEMTRATFALAPSGDKVKLTLTLSKIENRQSLISSSSGWHILLDLFEALLANAPGPKFWTTIARLEDEYEKRLD